MSTVCKSHDMSNSQNIITSAHAQCLLMCPISEQKLRQNSNDLHILEKIGDLSNPSSSFMIKKYQRSSADHNLKIKENIRTPPTLLKTITHIENNIMTLDKNKTHLQLEFENNNISPSLKNTSASHQQSINTFMKNKNNVPSDVAVQSIDILQIYLFVWDRYRMVAKDFILQSPPERSDLSIWIECYERMIRWHVIMSYRLHNNQEYVRNHHHQNLESLNNLMKTLHSVLYPSASAILHHDNINQNNSRSNSDTHTIVTAEDKSPISHNISLKTPASQSQNKINTYHMLRHKSEFTSYMLLLHFNSTTTASSSSCHLSEILKLSLHPVNKSFPSDLPTPSSVPSTVDDGNYDVLRLAIQLCVAIHRRDSYLFFKLIKYISTKISNSNNKSSASTPPVTVLHVCDSSSSHDHCYKAVYPLILSLLLSSLHTMRVYTIECLYKGYLKNTELAYEYLMDLLLIPTIIELLHFITQDCKMDYNRQRRTVVLNIVLNPTGTAGVNASVEVDSKDKQNHTAASTTAIATNTTKLNVEKMLETPEGRTQLNQTVQNILQPPTNKEEEFIYTSLESLDEYIGTSPYNQICAGTSSEQLEV